MATKKPPETNADNMAIWEANQTTDPKFVKPITGRGYSGTSPNVSYLIRKATATFGPVGHGFGWTTLDEKVLQLRELPEGGNESLHVIRIDFWYLHPTNGERSHFESIGQTKLSYQTSRGGFFVDEDAPKKSLTDAITKALSFLGFSADIYLGMYDDNKYVASLKEREGAASPPKEQTRKPDPTEPLEPDESDDDDLFN